MVDASCRQRTTSTSFWSRLNKQSGGATYVLHTTAAAILGYCGIETIIMLMLMYYFNQVVTASFPLILRSALTNHTADTQYL